MLYVYKSMGNQIPNDRRTVFIFVTLLAMLAALFVSRAALSVSMMAFIAATCVHRNFFHQLRVFFKSPVPAGMGLLFLVPLVSGLWSSDLDEWSDIIRIKLPLLFLPLAFSGSWQLQQRQWQLLAYCMVLLLVLGSAWSLVQYLQNSAALHEGYLRAKVMATPLGNDHVRFSWLVSSGILLCLLLLPGSSRKKTTMLLLATGWLVVYLHVLAARTGLASFYLVAAGYLLWMLVQKKRVKAALPLLAALLLLPVLAWLVLPTFQNRLRYFIYEYPYIHSGAYLPGANDGNRVQSYRAGWHLLCTHPLGVGAGDVYATVNRWYDAHVPHMAAGDRLYPSSEWLLYGGAAGWPGLLLFTVALLLPFLYPPPRNRLQWRLLHLTLAGSLAIDIGLEVQYGVFLYSFIVLWWWKWFSHSKEAMYEGTVFDRDRMQE